MPYLDAFNRPINYLRISVTDRCNLRCFYCMPVDGVPYRPHEEILRYEEIERVVRAAVGLGITRVRLTGGEPLIRTGFVDLVAMLARIPGMEDLALTTNGTLLPRYAEALRRAGLQRVNVSLDSLREERYARITRGGRLSDTLKGIERADSVGLRPLKINAVVLRGFNDDETVDLARLTLEHDWQVRYIEMMPLDCNLEQFATAHMPNQEVREAIIASLGELEPAGPVRGSGPASYYRLSGALGTIGFISPVSDHFCSECNRLRLTADGRLRPCLLADTEIDLKSALRRGAGMGEIQELLKEAILAKPRGHQLAKQILPHGRGMSEIGG